MSKIKTLVVSIILLVIWFVIAFGPYYIERNKNQKPLHIHEANSNGKLEVDWIVNDLIISTGEKTTNLFVSNNKLYLYGALDSWDFALWQISKSGGEFLKNVTPSRLSIPLSFDDIDAISFDSNFIYVAYTGDHTIKDSSIAAGGFAVYDTFREELIWSSRIPSLNGVDSFIAGQGFIVVDNGFGKYYIADVTNNLWC